MRAFGFGAENAVRRRRGLAVPPSPAIPIAGFTQRGDNTALRAMLARAAAGAGRGTIVMKGDSTTAGAGGAIVSGAGTVVEQLTGARPYRPSAVLAAELTQTGWPTGDSAFVSDNHAGAYGVSLAAYDPRVSFPGDAWSIAQDYSLAGGGYLNPAFTLGQVLEFRPEAAVSAFEVVLFNTGGVMAFAIDGAAATGVTASTGGAVAGNTVTLAGGNAGFVKVTVPCGAGGVHTLGMAANSGSPLLRSAAGLPPNGLVILNHAANGAQSGDQAATNIGGYGWSNIEALRFDAPDLTIVNLGLNDGAQGVSGDSYAANLRAIVAAAQASGDVLLVSPHPASPSFAPTATQTALRDVAAAVAADRGVSHLDLFAHFGSWTAVASRSADGLVHPNRGLYADIGQLYRRCIQAMAA